MTDEKQLTPNEEYYLYNTSPEAYKRLGDGIGKLRQVNSGHARMRGRYSEYPARMLTVDPATQLFVRCENCGRQHCTDPWMPGVGAEPGYIALNDRVRMVAVPDQIQPWLSRSIYYCTVDLQRCLSRSPK